MADFRRTGEGDFVDIHVARNCSARGRTVAGKNVDNARWEPSFVDELADAQRGERSLLRGLEHNGAACRESGTKLPRLHQKGEIPRDDLAGDADRLMLGVGEIRAIHWYGFALILIGPAGVIAIASDGKRHVRGAGDLIGLAVIERLELR